MDHHCLFIVNGLGMGNSTRCYAIMEWLAEKGVKIHVLTSGNGLTFFHGKREISSLTPMEAFFYSGSHGRVSGWKTIASSLSLGRLALIKKTQLEQLLSRIHPDVAVIDSEYMISPLRKRRIPIIGLNNSDVIVSEYFRQADPPPPPTIKSHFWFVEFWDYLFHRTFCDFVLSPSTRLTPLRHPKFKRIGLVIRRVLYDAISASGPRPFPRPRDIRHFVFMLSGSIFASAIPLDRQEWPFQIDVVGRKGISAGPVAFHGRMMHNVDLLMKADAFVINGGFSAVSEVLALGRPTLAIPVPGHAEQYFNARIVHDMGMGLVVNDATVMDTILRLVQANEWLDFKERRTEVEIDGARRAAEHIWSVLVNRRPSKATEHIGS